MDIINELFARNQLDPLTDILIHAGSVAVSQCLQVSKSWNAIISVELGHWPSLLRKIRMGNKGFQLIEGAVLRRHPLGGEQTLFFHWTDLRRGIYEKSLDHAEEGRGRIDAGGTVTCCLLYSKVLYTGMMDGRIKLWKLKGLEKALKIFQSRESSPVACLAAHEYTLISASANGSLLLWDLRFHSLVRVLRASYSLREMNLSSNTTLWAISKTSEEDPMEMFVFHLNDQLDIRIQASAVSPDANDKIYLIQSRGFFVYERNEGLICTYELSEFGYLERDVVVKGVLVDVEGMDVLGDLLVYILRNGVICLFDMFQLTEIRRISICSSLYDVSALRIAYSFIILLDSSGILVYHLLDEFSMRLFSATKPDHLVFDRGTIAFREGHLTIRTLDLLPRYLREYNF